jgi:metallo-beta-lactamase family protein
VGYQALGTRGRDLQEGKKEIKIHGEFVPIHCRIETLPGTSEHADYLELLEWLRGMKQKPKKLFVTHGEVDASEGLVDLVKKELKWNAVVPDYLEKTKLI